MLKNFGLLLVSLLLALLFAEAGLRLVFQPSSALITDTGLRRSEFYHHDPELTFIPRPDVRGAHEKRGSFEATFTTNSLGLRDREHTLEKPRGVTRIAVVGDSFAWGFGVHDGQEFPAILETRLPGVEVINLGVSGFGLYEEIRYFRRLGIAFDPDILLVALFQNDITAIPLRDRPEVTDAEPVPPPATRFIAFKRALAERSRLYALVTDAVSGNRTIVELLVRSGIKGELSGVEQLDPAIRPALREPTPEVTAGWERTFDHLRAFQRLSDSLQIRLIVALVPTVQAVDQRQLERTLSRSRFWVEDFDMDSPHHGLAAFAAEAGIEIIDPLDAFKRAFENGERHYLDRDMHFNAQGHAAFADAIAAYLERNGPATPPAR